MSPLRCHLHDLIAAHLLAALFAVSFALASAWVVVR